MIVSLFKNVNEIDKNLKIIDLLQDIKSGTYRNLLTYLRKSLADNKMEAYERAKKSLPAFTPSATFKDGRKIEFIQEYINLVVLDITRRASFAGSVNTAQFLNDTTGSRRFLCFEVEHIEYAHNIDINLAYAQAKQLVNEGFRYWFNEEEIKEINANNEQYQIRSPEEELLLTWFELADRDTANGFLNTTQIATKLAEKAKFNITMKLGKALKKHGYLRLSKKNGYVYAVRELQWDEVEKKNKEKEPPISAPPPPEQTKFRFGK